MKKNFVLALTRTCGGGATPIAEMLAKRLGIAMYDRNLLRLASDDSGISEELFAKADETMKQSMLFRVSQSIYQGELIPPDSDDFTSLDNLFNYQAKVLKELANEESYIVIGRAADYVLKDNPNMISIFIHAPKNVCIEREMDIMGFDAKAAEKYIIKTDNYRRDYYKYHTGRTWENPYNYDLCLNTGVLSYEQCCDIIEEYIKTRIGE